MEEKVSNLWKWFIDNEHKIIQAFTDESLSPSIVENLNNLILDFGMFYWEIGPGKIKPWYLTISPNGDKDLMKLSRSVIQQAPDLPDWEFNYCKQAKDWDRKFVIYDNNMNEQSVDASNWKYVSQPKSAGMVALTLEAGNISHLDQDSASIAANLFVIGEIGEERKILKIFSIDIVPELDRQFHSHSYHIKHLKDHLAKP